MCSNDATVQERGISNKDKLVLFDKLVNKHRQQGKDIVMVDRSQESRSATVYDQNDPAYIMAKEQIIRETKQASKRADSMGPQGWKRAKCLLTNKDFLLRTIEATLPKKKRRQK
ncbi:hypothetical protein AB6A40_007904 [Gnathostoma spinigerum]|uniref:Uncharacterized protein n=1 Tax=Gnathostoma spinigerum TaxID=75299 RepID=A0ABD6EY71_9BILA